MMTIIIVVRQRLFLSGNQLLKLLGDTSVRAIRELPQKSSVANINLIGITTVRARQCLASTNFAYLLK